MANGVPLEKSLILIDGENVKKSWQNCCKEKNILEKIDYIKLVNKLSENTNKLRAIFYDGLPEVIPVNKKNFLEALQKQGITIKTKILKHRINVCPNCKEKTDKYVQKGVDVSLACDIVRHAFQQTCDICIIVSGDEDYKDAIELAKDKGMKIWLASFKNSLSKDIQKSVDKTVFLDDIFDDIKM